MDRRCSDPRLQQMTHAYELGMLSGKELDEFERHLLECEECATRVEKMADVGQMISRDPEAATVIREVIAEAESGRLNRASVEPVSPQRSRQLLPFLSVSAAAAILLLILILKPWQIIIRSEAPVLAEGRLTIMYFENLADPEDTLRLGEIATNLLITDLAESRYLQVLSSQRLSDILRLLERDGAETINRNIAELVARKASAKWLLQGSIAQTQPQLVLTAQVSEVSSGDVIASQRIDGRPGESLIAVIDRLSAEIKRKLPLSHDAAGEPNRLLADMTTRSWESYRCYAKGVDYFNKAYASEAKASFEEALRYDSTFAMSYYYLAQLSDCKLIDKAKEHAANASEKDRYFIDIYIANMAEDKNESARLLDELLRRYPDEKSAYLTLARIEHSRGHIDRSIEMYRKAIEMDSLYETAYAYLTYLYDNAGRPDLAFETVDAYIRIAPDEANSYDTKADILVAHGRNEEASQLYRQALSLKPDFTPSLEKLGLLALTDGNAQLADSCLGIIARSSVRGSLRVAGYYQLGEGRLASLLQTYDSTIALPGARTDYQHRAKALVYASLRDWDAALSEIQIAYDEHLDLYPKDSLAYQSEMVTILTGKGDTVAAQELIGRLREWLRIHDYSEAYYWKMAGEVALAAGNLAEAISHLDNIPETNRDFTYHCLAGRAYLQSGRGDEAIRIFSDLVRPSPFFSVNPFWAFEVEYYLAQAYESTAQHSEATLHYRRFIDRWKNAEPETVELKDAKARLLALSKST